MESLVAVIRRFAVICSGRKALSKVGGGNEINSGVGAKHRKIILLSLGRREHLL